MTRGFAGEGSWEKVRGKAGGGSTGERSRCLTGLLKVVLVFAALLSC